MKPRSDRQHSLEDALAMMSVTNGELRLLDAMARYAQRPSRREMVNTVARAEAANTLARYHLSLAWDGMEAGYHEQA